MKSRPVLGPISLVLLWVAMPVAAPSAAREVPSHAEPLTELEQRYLTAIDHQFRSLQRIVSLRGESGEGATAGPACSQAGHEVLLQRLERRLELWGSRLGQERYRRNFPRMLRDLQARLRRLEAEVAAPAPAVVEAPRAEGQTLPDSDSAERVCKRGSPPAVPTPPPDGVTQLAPANDDCAAAAILVAGTVSGETLTATTDGSTTCGGSGPDVWFRYVAVADGLVQFDTVGSDYDTVLSLHSGCPGTTDNQLECNDDWFGLQSRVVHAMTVGQEVLVRVGGCCGGDTGNFQLNAGAVGGISGTVSDASTGLPLDGVDMRLSDALGYWVMGDQTNGDGAYEFPGVGAGTYYVSTRYTEDYVDELYDDFVCQPGCDEELGTPIMRSLASRTVGPWAGAAWSSTAKAATGSTRRPRTRRENTGSTGWPQESTSSAPTTTPATISTSSTTTFPVRDGAIRPWGRPSWSTMKPSATPTCRSPSVGRSPAR
jgi:hypothetical protein